MSVRIGYQFSRERCPLRNEVCTETSILDLHALFYYESGGRKESNNLMQTMQIQSMYV